MRWRVLRRAVNNSNEAAIVMQLAAYIRNLGFQAIASMNDTALVIPYAIKAGLGECERNQMVLTLEVGPGVQFACGFARSTTTIKERSGIGGNVMVAPCRAVVG